MTILTKISVWAIVRGQLGTMRHYGTKKYDFFEIGMVFLLPLLSLAVKVSLVLSLSQDTVSIIVSAASIFAGLLLNLLVLLYSILSSLRRPDNNDFGIKDENERDLIEHLFYNISFSILVCVVLVVSAILTLTKQGWWVAPAEALAYYTGMQLFFLVLQILKRFHSLLEFKIARKSDLAQGEARAGNFWKTK